MYSAGAYMYSGMCTVIWTAGEAVKLLRLLTTYVFKTQMAKYLATKLQFIQLMTKQLG